MAYPYDVFDAEEVQYETRRKVTRLLGVVLAAVVLTVLAALLAHGRYASLPVVGGSVFAVWLTTIWWVSRRLRQLRRVVWCIKLSKRRLVGYDYARRTIKMDWAQVQRVEVSDDDLRIVASRHCSIDVPSVFPRFAALSHQVVFHAEAHGVPVHLDGQPFDDLDVRVLFPFLEETLSRPDGSSSDRPGAARGPAAL